MDSTQHTSEDHEVSTECTRGAAGVAVHSVALLHATAVQVVRLQGLQRTVANGLPVADCLSISESTERHGIFCLCHNRLQARVQGYPIPVEPVLGLWLPCSDEHSRTHLELVAEDLVGECSDRIV
jgi:hypothetical protein